jgi:hypothetical protein
MDRFPPAEETPHYELQSIGRGLGDASLANRRALPPRVIVAHLFWTALVLVALLAFVGWLLVG